MKRLGCLAVGLVVLLAALLGIDSWARGEAESRAADALGSRLGTTPEVTAHGFPFLATLLTGTAPQVDVTAPSATLTIQGHQVDVTELDVQGRQVGPVSDLADAHAQQLDATTVVGYEQVSRAMDVTMSSAGGNRVRLTGELLGNSFEVVAVPSVQAGRLELADPQVSVGGFALPVAQAQAVVDRIEDSAELPSVANLELTGLRAEPRGVELTVHGTDVALSELG